MPGVLLRALSEYKFVGTPLWRMSDGKDLVRVELTFPKKLPTPRFYKKGTESRRQPAPPLPARSSYKTAATSSTDADREGDATNADTDYTTETATDHQTTLQEHSYHHRITDLHQTTTSLSRVTTFKESQKRISSTSDRSPDPVLLLPLRRRIHDPREVRPPGRSQQHASWKRRCNH